MAQLTSSDVGGIPQPTDCILTFHDLEAQRSDGHPLLHGLTGYVRRGGVTAVLGQGGSGKSLVLRLLCGREPLLQCSGTVACQGAQLSLGRSGFSSLGFVGQEDVGLVGELTPREVITFSARLGSAALSSDAERRQIVDGVIQRLGLESVADNAIGTVLKRGLSGGEKRRVSVGAVLASRPAVICLDEPTSGLDAAVAFSVIQSIKALAQSHGIGVLLTIHQPSARILSLFDDLIVLNAGYAVFVGPTALSIPHFEALGFPCPPSSTATDHFLDVIHQHGADDPVFVQGYRRSPLKQAVDCLRPSDSTQQPGGTKPLRVRTSLAWQTLLLSHRHVQIGLRDVSLYWLQLVLAVGFAFLTGAVFWSVPRVIGPRLQDQSNALVWLSLIAAYLQVFKIYHLFSSKNRVHDERANGLYSTTAWSLSTFAVTALFVFAIYVPALLVGYGMMALPDSAIGFVIFTLFLTALTAEALLELLLQFTSHLPTAILLGQGALVILCVFAGNSFIRWSSLGFWVWLSDLSLFTFSTRGMMIVVYRDMHYTCPPAYVSAAGQCTYNAITYPCASAVSGDGSCTVAGSAVLQLYQHVSETDEWFQLGMLVVLLAGFRLLTHVFLHLPPREMVVRLRGAVRTLARRDPSKASPAIPLATISGEELHALVQVAALASPTVQSPVASALATTEHVLTFRGHISVHSDEQVQLTPLGLTVPSSLRNSVFVRADVCLNLSSRTARCWWTTCRGARALDACSP